MGNLENDLIVLNSMAGSNLEDYYKETFGVEPPSKNPKYLRRAIAYKLQESSLEGLPDETEKKIEDLISIYDPVNRKSFKANPKSDQSTGRDIRLPMPGTFILKTYKGRKIEVKVLEYGFGFEGKFFKHLSHLAYHITGAHWNGFAFFGLPSKSSIKLGGKHERTKRS